MARLPDFAQGIVALDVGPWFGRQRQSLGRLYRRRVRWSPIDQAVQQVQDMGLRRGAGLQRQFDGGEHGLFVMLEDQGQNLTISRSPPGVLSMRCCRARKAGGSSTKGAPLRRAPGL